MYDLHVELADGSYVDAAAAIEGHRGRRADDLESVEPRLVEPTQVDASSDDELVLVPGRSWVSMSDGGPEVNRIRALEGRR